VKPLVRTLRPQQWVKNVFVAAPVVFSHKLEDTSYLWREAVAVLAFCMLSGAVYCFNDVRDVEADKLHPTKKHRPIASGQLSERTALVASATLAVVALAACFALHWQVALWAGIYFAQNLAYSVKLKHVAFLDVTLIASGFLLRVLGGAAAIGVPASHWVLICTTLLAMFFGLGKRAHELAWAARSGSAHVTRASLAGYKIEVVRLLMFVLGLATIGAYFMYTVDPNTREFFHTDYLAWSTPWVAVGIVRFLFLAIWYPKDLSPTEAMMRDPYFLAILAGATATVLYIIYG
jgi:4-hydroxybenzoate polyprenyltransferase